jgi:amino acid adenylation domain-containing protein
MLVQAFLEASAKRHPQKVALVCGERRFTYRELDLAANRLARALCWAGVQRGDRVAILLENSAEAVIAIFGTLKAGGAVMALHPSTTPERLSLLLRDATPAAMITDSRHGAEAADALGAAPSLRCLVWADNQPTPVAGALCSICWRDLTTYPAERLPCTAIDRDLASLIYTSGSTGQPKGVMLTHANTVAVETSIATYLENTADDVLLNTLPLAHGYGLSQILTAFYVGARVVLERSFAFPARVVSLLEAERVTGFAGVPTAYALLLRYPDLLRRHLPALRYLTNAAAALPTNHLTQIRAVFPHARFFSMYGQTECRRISYLPPEELDRRPSSVGIAIPSTEASVVDADGRQLGPGVVGELVVRGPHVALGYWRAPELTARTFRAGTLPGETVLHTGDLFQTDEDGFLYFVARKDDVIKTRGEKVSPCEVEAALCQLGAVAEAAVVGVPDPVLGQAVLAVVAPRAGVQLTERQVRAHCARLLADYMVPKYVALRAELPHTDNGKVDRLRLSAEFAACAVS